MSDSNLQLPTANEKPSGEGVNVAASQPNLGGAPLGNLNRQTHGLRTWKASRRLPRGCKLEEQELLRFEAELTEAVRSQYGQVSAEHEGIIGACSFHYGRCLLTARWLRHSKRTLAEKLSLSKEQGAAAESFTRELGRLRLSKQPDVPGTGWGSLERPAWMEGQQR